MFAYEAAPSAAYGEHAHIALLYTFTYTNTQNKRLFGLLSK